jgi:RNA polymerase sigma factor (sigma-70 family)
MPAGAVSKPRDGGASLAEANGACGRGRTPRVEEPAAPAAADAFQATFFTLARRAGSIHRADALGGWLHCVAHRLAAEARARGKHEYSGEVEAAGPPDDPVRRELRRALEEEIDRLPGKYRLPVVLCYLEGRTTEDAARELGCPKGTVGTRLAWARRRLAARLTRRGLALSGGLLAAAFAGDALSAAVACGLVRQAVHAGLAATGDAGAAGAVPVSVTALAEGVMKTMLWTKVKLVAAAGLALLLASAGGGFLGYRTIAAGQPAGVAGDDQPRRSGQQPLADAQAEQVRREAERLTLQQQLLDVQERLDRLDRERQVLLLKREELKTRLVRPAPPNREAKHDGHGERIEVPSRQDGVLSTSGPCWKKGDHVKVGQVLARLDDRLARQEIQIKTAKLEQSEADLQVSEKTRDEAQVRLERCLRLPPAVRTQEEVDSARLTAHRYQAEVMSKRAAVTVASAELRQAQAVLETYVIVCPVAGVVRSIDRRPGEWVKQGQTVLVVQEEDR